MLGVGFSELIFLFLLIVIIFGADKTLHLARRLGEVIAAWRREWDDFGNDL